MTRTVACLLALIVLLVAILILFIPLIAPDSVVRYSPYIRQVLWARQIKKDAGGYDKVYGPGGMTFSITETFGRRVCSWGSDPVVSILPYLRADGSVVYGALRACEFLPPDRRFIPPLFALLSSKEAKCRELALQIIIKQPISPLSDEESIRAALLSIYPDVRIGIWDIFLDEGDSQAFSPAFQSAVAEGKRLYGPSAFGGRGPRERILRKAGELKE